MKPLTNSQKILKATESKAPDKARSSFLSHVSHGIRTPLNSIMGFSRLLIDRNMIDDKPKEYAKHIVYSSNVLLNFVENLIDLSQYESNNYVPKRQEVKLHDLLWTVAENFMRRRNGHDFYAIDLEVLWEQDTKVVSIYSDFDLLKKSVNKLVDLVAAIYLKGKLVIGYNYLNENQVKIFVKPSKGTFLAKPESPFMSEDDSASFCQFNFEVLSHSVELLGGRVCTDSIMNEYYIEIPLIWGVE